MMVYSKAILESDYTVACMIALINIVLSLGLFSSIAGGIAYRRKELAMLIWSPKGRAAAGVVASVLFIVFFPAAGGDSDVQP